MHHDGMHYFPLPKGSNSSNHGLLAVNFEYTDDGLLHTDGMDNWSSQKVQKSKNAHGIGVMEIRFDGESWKVVKNSPYGRRITADTQFFIKGPAAGHPLIQTAFDRTGRMALGTWNNCAHGITPWGTYLSCEENVTPYFIARSGRVSRLLDRYGVDAKSWGFRWHEFDPRFDSDLHPNEPNRHGWVVEIDPYDPSRPPVNHTAMGRMAHENAALSIVPDGRVLPESTRGQSQELCFPHRFELDVRLGQGARRRHGQVLIASRNPPKFHGRSLGSPGALPRGSSASAIGRSGRRRGFKPGLSRRMWVPRPQGLPRVDAGGALAPPSLSAVRRQSRSRPTASRIGSSRRPADRLQR